MAKSVIRWTDEQRASVIAHSASLLLETPSMTKLAALQAAQKKLLPEAIQKNDRSIASYGVYLEEAQRKILEALQPQTHLRQPVDIEQAVAQESAPAPVQQDEPWLQQANADLRAGLNSVVDDFVAVVTRNMAEKLRAGLEPFIQQMQADTQQRMAESIQAMTAAYEPPKFSDIAAPAKPKRRLPTVLVIGTKNSQARILEREFDGVLRLTCKTSDEASSLRPGNCSYDAILLWTDYADHHHMGKFKRQPNFTLVSGGMTSVTESLLQLSIKLEDATHV